MRKLTAAALALTAALTIGAGAAFAAAGAPAHRTVSVAHLERASVSRDGKHDSTSRDRRSHERSSRDRTTSGSEREVQSRG